MAVLRRSGLVQVFWISLGIAGCGGTEPSSNVRVRAELVRLPGASTSAPAYAPGPGGTTSLVRPWSSQLAITSLRGPVMGILLKGPGRETIEVYRCTGALADDCLVELNGPALQDLLNTDPIVVAPGTYDRVTIEYCRAELKYHAYLTGSVSIGGTTYFTRTSGNLGAAGPAEPVPMLYNGCGSEYAISTPLVVTDTVSIPVVLRLYFDVRDIAYAALGDPTTTSLRVPGCSPVTTVGLAPFVCAAYPTVAAVEGTTPPQVERYRVNGGATIGLMFEAGTDRFIGGYFRKYVVEDLAWNPGFMPDAFVESLTLNTGGTYTLHQVGGVTFPAFRRTTHSGTATDQSGNPFAYSAERLP